MQNVVAVNTALTKLDHQTDVRAHVLGSQMVTIALVAAK